MGATAFAAASLGLTAYGTYTGIESQGIQGQFQRKMYDINSQIAGYKAEDAIKRGEEESSNYQKKVAGVVGSQRAALAANGVDVNYGTAQEMQDETRSMGALDALRIKNNAMLEAWGYKTEAANLGGSSAFSSLAQSNTQRNMLLTGGLRAAEYGSQIYNSPSSSKKSGKGTT